MSELCCCEYYDADGNRTHIVMCCCNCFHLDESFERIITCRRVPASLCAALNSTIMDRLRIPWYGGARPMISLGMPFIYVPILLGFAAISLPCTIIASFIATVILLVAWKSAMIIPKFFIAWMLVSTALILLIFEFIVIPTLLILPHENMQVLLLLTAMGLCITKMHIEVRKLCNRTVSNDDYCPICQIGGVEHKYWIDTCVTPNTRKYYLMTTFCGSFMFLYIANLIFTTLCHVFRPFRGHSLLLPDNCNEAYASYTMSLPFVTAIYCTCIGAILFAKFLINLFTYTQCLRAFKLKKAENRLINTI